MSSFSGLTLVLFCFRICNFIEAAALRSIVLQYLGAPTAARVSFFFLLFLWRCRFFRVFLYHCRFIFVWRVRRTLFPSGWYFSTLRPWAGFFTSAYVRRKKRMSYSPYKEKTAMVQKYAEKATSPNKQKEKRKKHLWLSGRLHIEERLNAGARLQ